MFLPEKSVNFSGTCSRAEAARLAGLHRGVLALLTLGLVALVLGIAAILQVNSLADDPSDDLFSIIELKAAARSGTVRRPDPLLAHALPGHLPAHMSAGSSR